MLNTVTIVHDAVQRGRCRLIALRRSEKALLAIRLTLLLSILWIVYRPALQNGFVWLDHTEILQGNLIIRSMSDAVTVFLHDRNYAGYHRPINNLLHTLDVSIWGYNPFGHHLSSVLLHMVNATLLFFVVEKFLRSGTAALVVAVLWGLHPANAATVGLIGSRADLSAATMLLVSTRLLMSGLLRFGSQRYILFVAGIGCYVLALLSKEVAFAFPILVTIVFVAYARDLTPSDRMIDRRRLVATLWCVTAVAIAIRLVITPPEIYHSSLSISRRILTFVPVYLQYITTLALPLDVVVSDTVTRFSSYSHSAQFGLLAAFAMVVAIQIALSVRVPRAWLAIAIFNVFLLPVAQVIPTLHFRADRFLYLPSIGFALCCVICVRYALSSMASRNEQASGQVLTIMLSLVLVMLVVAAFRQLVANRLELFRNNITLFGHEVQRTPHYREGLCFLATEFDKNGDPTRAEDYYRRCLAANPDEISYLNVDAAIVNATNNLLTLRKGREVEVLAQVMGGLVRNPRAREELSYNVAVAAFQSRRYLEALPIFVQYSERHPEDAGCQYLLGVSARALGQLTLAADAFRAYLVLVPDAENRKEVESWLEISARH